jgi:hypothetical protein
MKDYRYLGEDADLLGRRLDAARKVLKNTDSVWAKNYWTQTIKRLEFQWRQLPILHDADAKMTLIPRWHVDYEFFEKGPRGEGSGVVEKIFDKFSLSVNLDHAWNAHRERRLARAQ